MLPCRLRAWPFLRTKARKDLPYTLVVDALCHAPRTPGVLRLIMVLVNDVSNDEENPMNKYTRTLLKLSLCSAFIAPGLAAACGTEPCDPPPPTTCLSVVKLASPDGFKPWFDANTEAEAVTIGSNSKFLISLVNCGTEKLVNVHFSDPLLSVDSYFGGINPESEIVMDFSAADVCKDRYGLVKNTASASGTGESSAVNVEASDVAWVNCGDKPPMGGEGCTPGYWKQTQHFDSWSAPYTPTTRFSAVFGHEIAVRAGGKSTIVDPTLLQALEASGGNINAAARHVVAALLNAASSGVSYNMTAGEVIDLFNANYPDGDLEDMKDRLEMYNEQGCPLN